MNKSDIVKACLDIEFGSDPKNSLKSIVNKALDEGEYFDGFEIAIKKHDLDYKEFDELLFAFKTAYLASIPDMDAIRALADRYLPQAYFTKMSWLVSECGEIFATDGLRVAKFYNNTLIWVTRRISYDGINFVKLTENKLYGNWFNPVDDESPWSELIISAEDGALLKGEVIEF